ncbi:MAG: ROK family protein [Clostridia bacterium]|nr:ROK family protein [Clostridia bacterium]
MYYIGIDLGGTNIAAGIVDDAHQLCYKLSIKTSMDQGFDGLCEDMAQLCRQLVKEMGIGLEEIKSVGIGCPGMINERTGEIVFSNNLDIYHENLVEKMEGLLWRPVYCANDANAAALGEYAAGGGASASSLVAITLGTGVGSGIIIDGKMVGGFNYSGGELGHMVIKVHGRRCTCGRRGCLETYASATGLIQSTKDAMLHDETTLLWDLVEGDLECVTGKTVFDAREQGDLVAAAVVEEYIGYLAVGLANIVNAFQPEVITIGGGISHQGDWLMAALQEKVDTQVFGRFGDKQTRIKRAQLGNDAGIIGAALLGSIY